MSTGTAPVAINDEAVSTDLARLKSEAGEGEQATHQTLEQLSAQQQAEQIQQETQQAMQLCLHPLFAIVAPNWQVQPAEIEALSGAYTAVLLKYWPEGLAAVGPEFAAVLITATVIAPRMRIPRKLEPKETEPTQSTATEPAQAAA